MVSFRGIERELDLGALARLAVVEIVQLNDAGVLAYKLDVDLVMRFAEIWACIGEEGRNQARALCWTHDGFVAAIAICAEHLHFCQCIGLRRIAGWRNVQTHAFGACNHILRRPVAALEAFIVAVLGNVETFGWEAVSQKGNKGVI